MKAMLQLFLLSVTTSEAAARAVHTLTLPHSRHLAPMLFVNKSALKMVGVYGVPFWHHVHFLSQRELPPLSWPGKTNQDLQLCSTLVAVYRLTGCKTPAYLLTCYCLFQCLLPTLKPLQTHKRFKRTRIY